MSDPNLGKPGGVDGRETQPWHLAMDESDKVREEGAAKSEKKTWASVLGCSLVSRCDKNVL